jgi:hypothetical protein
MKKIEDQSSRIVENIHRPQYRTGWREIGRRRANAVGMMRKADSRLMLRRRLCLAAARSGEAALRRFRVLAGREQLSLVDFLKFL